MKRVLTAAVLVPIAVAVALWAPRLGFVAAVVLVAALSYREYSQLVRQHGIPGLGAAGYAAGLLVLTAPWDGWLMVVLLAALFLTLAMRSQALATVLPRASAMLLGVIYIFGGWRSGLALRDLDRWWLLFVWVVNWVGDTAAYYVGRKLGKRKLSPQLSPAKTWEGAVASCLAALLCGWAYARVIWPWLACGPALLAAAVCNLAGQIGDLAESALKRGAGVKDSGNLLPGHGGCLDRTDGLLFSMPVVYGLLRLLGLG